MYILPILLQKWIRRCKEKDFLNNQQILMMFFSSIIFGVYPLHFGV